MKVSYHDTVVIVKLLTQLILDFYKQNEDTMTKCLLENGRVWAS